MASSSITFASYAPPTSNEGHLRLRSQMRTWLPVLAFAMVFVVESTPYFGADRTSDPLQRMVEAIFGYDACVHWDLIHHLIRKSGGRFLAVLRARAFQHLLDQDRLQTHLAEHRTAPPPAPQAGRTGIHRNVWRQDR